MYEQQQNPGGYGDRVRSMMMEGMTLEDALHEIMFGTPGGAGGGFGTGNAETTGGFSGGIGVEFMPPSMEMMGYGQGTPM